MEPLKEAVEAWLHRVRAPILGYSLLAGLAINWKPLWVLVFSDIDVFSRFSYFDLKTDVYTLVVWPVLGGLLSAALSPWIGLLGAHIVRQPAKMQRELQRDARVEQEIYQLVTQSRVEKAKAELGRAQAEQGLAKADLQRAQAEQELAKADLQRAKAELERARESIKLDELKRTQEAEELGQEAVEALRQARAEAEPSGVNSPGGHSPFVLSDLDAAAIKFLGNLQEPINPEKLSDETRGLHVFDKVLPTSTLQRIKVELNDASERLSKQGLTSKDRFGRWTLTSKGYEEHDRLSKLP